MILRDFKCNRCSHIFEELAPSDKEMELAEKQGWGWKALECPKCGVHDLSLVFNRGSATVLKKIIPIYPGCKKQKAGYTHTKHADHPATKIMSGPAGCQSPPT